MINNLIKTHNHKISRNLVYVFKKLKVKLEIHHVNQLPLGETTSRTPNNLKSLIKGNVNKRTKQNLNLILMIGNGGKGTKGNLQILAMIDKKQNTIVTKACNKRGCD